METLRRTIHPETRIVDRERGIVDYVASDETVDSFREIIRVDGWRFNFFEKNSPFVDSHHTGTISSVIGKVIGFRIDLQNRRLIIRVQWAIGVGNDLAELGWKMTVSGYLKAVSVGFILIKSITANSDPSKWRQQEKELGFDTTRPPTRIHLEQELIEVSAVVIPANPNALIAAQKAGVITDRDVELIQHRSGKNAPVFQIPFSPEPQQDQDTMRKNFLNKFDAITRRFDSPAPSAPGNGDQQQVTAPLILGAWDQATTLRTACEAVVAASPELRRYLRAAVNVLCRAPRALWGEAEIEFERELKAKALTTGDSGLGEDTTGQMPLSDVIYSLVLSHGAFRTLGVVLASAGITKLPALTGMVTGYLITPTNQGTPPTETATISGSSISPEAATASALVNVSAEFLNDGKTTFEGLLLMAFVEGLSYTIDRACFQADGTDDTTDGGMTGIFAHGSVPSVTAGAGGTSVANLSHDDFAALLGAVIPSALQQVCRFWISPVFLPSLLKIQSSGERLLKPPTSADDEWRIHGFPVTWAAAAPSAETAGAKIAAFGRGDAYSVLLRQELELRSSPHGPGWANNIYQFRALTRVRCEMRDPTSLATLKLGAA